MIEFVQLNQGVFATSVAFLVLVLGLAAAYAWRQWRDRP